MHSGRSHMMKIVCRQPRPGSFTVEKCGLLEIISSESKPSEFACDYFDIFRNRPTFQFPGSPVYSCSRHSQLVSRLAQSYSAISIRRHFAQSCEIDSAAFWGASSPLDEVAICQANQIIRIPERAAK